MGRNTNNAACGNKKREEEATKLFPNTIYYTVDCKKTRNGGVSGDHGVSDASKWNIKHGAALLTFC